MDEATSSLFEPALGNHSYYVFKPLLATIAVIVEIFFILLLGFGTLIFFIMWRIESRPVDVYLLVYGQILLWTVLLGSNLFLRWQHRLLRRAGYLNLCYLMNKSCSYPFYLSTVFNTLVLIGVAVYSEVGGNLDKIKPIGWLISPMFTFSFLIFVENLLLIYFVMSYLLKLRDFNNEPSLPDTRVDERWMPNALRRNLSATDIGYRERLETIDRMLEKQADLIRYYKETNDTLNKRILELNSRVRQTGIN